MIIAVTVFVCLLACCVCYLEGRKDGKREEKEWQDKLEGVREWK